MTSTLQERMSELLDEEQENQAHKIKMVAQRGLTKQETSVSKTMHIRKKSSNLGEIGVQREKMVIITPDNFRRLRIVSEQIDLA